MKVIEQTPDRLILENNPVVLAILLSSLALIFVAVGLFVISSDPMTGLATLAGALVFGAVFVIAFVRRSQIILDRRNDLVELRRKSLLGYNRRTWDLHDLDRAVIQTSRSDKSDTYRAALVFSGGMDAGVHPITLVYSSGSGASRAVAAINAWQAGALDSGAASA